MDFLLHSLACLKVQLCHEKLGLAPHAIISLSQ
jgi:hypothetical protein